MDYKCYLDSSKNIFQHQANRIWHVHFHLGRQKAHKTHGSFVRRVHESQYAIFPIDTV